MLKKYFCPSFSRKKPGCQNVVKTWKINLKTKTKKKSSKKHPLDRTLHENTGPNLCFSLYIGKAFFYFVLILKLIIIFYLVSRGFFPANVSGPCPPHNGLPLFVFFQLQLFYSPEKIRSNKKISLPTFFLFFF